MASFDKNKLVSCLALFVASKSTKDGSYKTVFAVKMGLTVLKARAMHFRLLLKTSLLQRKKL